MVVILHNIRSLHNVGSIFRTADAVGVEKIYLCGITPKPVDEFGKLRPQLTKVSLGAEKYIPWEKVASASRLIDRLKKEKYKIFAVEQSKKSIPYFKIKSYDSRHHKICMVMGNEVKGLPMSILKRADKILEIPMRGATVQQAYHPKNQKKKMVRQAHHKESLNVSIAFGIVAYYLTFGYNK